MSSSDMNENESSPPQPQLPAPPPLEPRREYNFKNTVGAASKRRGRPPKVKTMENVAMASNQAPNTTSEKHMRPKRGCAVDTSGKTVEETFAEIVAEAVKKIKSKSAGNAVELTPKDNAETKTKSIVEEKEDKMLKDERNTTSTPPPPVPSQTVEVFTMPISSVELVEAGPSTSNFLEFLSKRKSHSPTVTDGSTENSNNQIEAIINTDTTSSAIEAPHQETLLKSVETMANYLEVMAESIHPKSAVKKGKSILVPSFNDIQEHLINEVEMEAKISEKTNSASDKPSYHEQPLSDSVSKPVFDLLPDPVADPVDDNVADPVLEHVSEYVSEIICDAASDHISDSVSVSNPVSPPRTYTPPFNPVIEEKAPEPAPQPDCLSGIEEFILASVKLLNKSSKYDDDDDNCVDKVIKPTKSKIKDMVSTSPVSEPASASISDTHILSDHKPVLKDVEASSKLDEGLGDASISRPETPLIEERDLLNSELVESMAKSLQDSAFFGTPADTPINTPSSTPPHSSEEYPGVRRSHRIKQITKTPKALVGRGLVEAKLSYCLVARNAQVNAKNAQFLKEMEERLSNFQVIRENEYHCQRVISKEAKKMICDCFLTQEEEERGELGCGEDCLNRLLMIECGPDCNVKLRCTNNRFQKYLYSPCSVFRTEKKGFGIQAEVEIQPNEFLMEYVGEVIDGNEFERRRTLYSRDKNRHFYFMALHSDAIIDATVKGSISRFINHSCEPNAETQKWTVNGEVRIGFFSIRTILPGEEITFDYQYQRYGREAQRCFCESSKCRGWIGGEPSSDEGEQMEEDTDSDSIADAILAEENNTKIKDKKKREEGRKDSDEDPKKKLKQLLTLAAKAAKSKKSKQKVQKPPKPCKQPSHREDLDIEVEISRLGQGLKNQKETLALSRLMVRAKLPESRLNLLQILRKGETPCRRLFLDYHGLQLLHGVMSDDDGNMKVRMALLETLECLPISNKTMLTESKVYQTVRNWSGLDGSAANSLSPSDYSSKESSSSNIQPTSSTPEIPAELKALALKLLTSWDALAEVFRIPKRERIEQMKEHEREADRQYAEETQKSGSSDRYNRDRFGRSSRFSKPQGSKEVRSVTAPGPSSSDIRRRSGMESGSNSFTESTKHLSKEQRREMFALQVARETEQRAYMKHRKYKTQCEFFGYTPNNEMSQDMPVCVDPNTWTWFNMERKPLQAPPFEKQLRPIIFQKSTNPADYELPDVAKSLPSHWSFAITNEGNIYYYHNKHRIPQWKPPSQMQIHETAYDSPGESDLDCSTEEEDDVLLGMNDEQLSAYLHKRAQMRRQKRRSRLVGERPISPRRAEDRIYNYKEVKKYRERTEKMKKRKEDYKRKVAKGAPGADVECSDDDTPGALALPSYLLSSDEDESLVRDALLDKFMQSDKCVDELDALTSKRKLKRPLPPHRDLSVAPSTSAEAEACETEIKRSKKSREEVEEAKNRKHKEKFRLDIACVIVENLKAYRKESCTIGRIKTHDDFCHLTRKLTQLVMVKESKYCEKMGRTLYVTEPVKNKAREFIKIYMSKYGTYYERPQHDHEYKDIPGLKESTMKYFS